MTKQQFNEITEWQKATFSKSTPLSKIAHLTDELAELSYDLVNKKAEQRLEFADCFFLLFGCAADAGMTYEDICSAIQEKFEINKKRKWGEPKENGVVNHLPNKDEKNH